MKKKLTVAIFAISIIFLCPAISFASSSGNTSVYLNMPASTMMIDEVVPMDTTSIPNTGDQLQAITLLVILLLALAALIFFVYRKKKRERKVIENDKSSEK